MAGVGQRMITGVAKRMAGQFFKAIDDELTGAVVADRGGAVGCCGRRRRRAGGRRRRGRRPAGLRRQGGRRCRCGRPTCRRWRSAAVGGALLTLISVLIGYRLGRRTS